MRTPPARGERGYTAGCCGDDPHPGWPVDTRLSRGALDDDVEDAQGAGHSDDHGAPGHLIAEAALQSLVAAKRSALLREGPIVLGLQRPSLGGGSQCTRLTPGINHIKPATDTRLHDSGELLAVR